MHYYIDGYNLLFRVIEEKSNFSDLRQQIIEDLNRKAHLLGLHFTIVFDAQFIDEESSRSHYHSVEILFSNYGQTADDLILQEIKNERHIEKKTVVTSDKKLAWFARRCSAATESVEHFMLWLNKRYYNKLRHAQEKLTTKPSQEKKLPKISKKRLPISSDTPEACFDYYLEYFQKEADLIAKVKEAPALEKKEQKVSKKKIKKSEIIKSSPLSEQERWQNIFEERIHKDNSD